MQTLSFQKKKGVRDPGPKKNGERGVKLECPKKNLPGS